VCSSEHPQWPLFLNGVETNNKKKFGVLIGVVGKGFINSQIFINNHSFLLKKTYLSLSFIQYFRLNSIFFAEKFIDKKKLRFYIKTPKSHHVATR
jgi:hypothetical protein